MPFKIPSLSETRDFLLGVGKALFPDRNYGNLRSYHAKRATFLAAATTQLHSHVDTVQKDLHPLTAGDDGPIDDWGEVKGRFRKGATPARKAAAGRVRGVNGTGVDADEELVDLATGLRYKIANATSIPAALFIDADIVAIDTGEQTRLLKGTVLSFVATPVDLETEVVLQKDLDEDGNDEEQFGSYRKRVLAAFSDETAGGTQDDYVTWALKLDGIETAYAYPNRAGFGTVDVVGLHSGSGAARELQSGEVAELLAYLKTKAPAHIAATGGPLRVLDIVTDPQSVEIVLTPNGESAFAFDWTGGPLTVLAWTAGTRSLQFTTALPSTMKAGHRGSFKGVATAQDGTEFKIEALSAADTIILEEAPAVAPAATDLFYSGGPLVTPIRNAIVAHMNGETVYAGRAGVPLAQSAVESTVGLEVLAEGIGPANPGGIYGTWNGGLIRAVLGGIAIKKSGVRNYNIVTPAADYEATDDAFPNDAQIHLIIPSSVLIRGAT
jgi:uncharacterized phage protein gp47/JayE